MFKKVPILGGLVVSASDVELGGPSLIPNQACTNINLVVEKGLSTLVHSHIQKKCV